MKTRCSMIFLPKSARMPMSWTCAAPFTDLKDEYLYFKTDHHWTPNGAYRAYEQFCA